MSDGDLHVPPRHHVLRGGTVELDPALLEAIDDAISYGTWVADASGGVVHLSRGFLDLIGRDLSEARRVGWFDRLPLEDTATVAASWDRCVRIGGRWDQELRIRGVDGHWHTVVSRGAPLRDRDGHTVGFAGVHLDVTGRKRVFADLEDARAALDRIIDAPELDTDTATADVATLLCEEAQRRFAADLVSLWRRDGDLAVMLHQRPALRPLGTAIDLRSMPEQHDDLRASLPAYVASMDEARSEAERAGMRAIGAQAALTAPVAVEGATDHFFALSWFRPPAQPRRTLVAAARRFADQAGRALVAAAARDRSRVQAMQVNDDIANAFATARGALELGDLDEAARAIDRGMAAARLLMSELLPSHGHLAPGDLRREDADRGEGL